MIEVDEHEPLEIVRLLEPTLDVDLKSLNANGWADYKYTGEECFCHGSTIYNVERKTWDDLSNGIESVEEQLGNQMRLHPDVHSTLIIEGVAEPAIRGILVYRKMPGQNAFRSGLRGNRTQAFKSVRAWLRQVKKYWDVVFTYSMADTAVTVQAMYEADQKEEDQHSTFKRVFKDYSYRANPQVQRVLGASGEVRFGPVQAEAVVKKFGTAWRAFKAEPEEWMQIPGIGEITARQYLRGLGRGDV